MNPSSNYIRNNEQIERNQLTHTKALLEIEYLNMKFEEMESNFRKKQDQEINNFKEEINNFLEKKQIEKEPIQNSDDIKDIIVNNSLELKEVKELIKSNIDYTLERFTRKNFPSITFLENTI